MPESYFERRKRELGITGGASSRTSTKSQGGSFFERRKIELGLKEAPVTETPVSLPQNMPEIEQRNRDEERFRFLDQKYRSGQPLTEEEDREYFRLKIQREVPQMPSASLERYDPNVVRPPTPEEAEQLREYTERRYKEGFGSGRLNPLAREALEQAGGFVTGAINAATLGLADRLTGGAISEAQEERGRPLGGTIGEIVGQLAPIGAAYRLTRGISRLIPTQNRILQNLARGAAAGATYSTAEELADAALDTRRDEEQTIGERARNIATETALFAAGDAAISAFGRVIGNAYRRFLQRQREPQEILALPEPRSAQRLREAQKRSRLTPGEEPIQAQGDIYIPALPAGNYVRPPRLRVLSSTEALNSVMERIRPIVMERMTPPYENKNELARWVRSHLGEDISLNEVRKLSYEDLRQLAELIRRELNVYNESIKAARELGYDLPRMLEGRGQDLRGFIESMRQRRVYGIYPERSVPIQRPQFNISVTGQAAGPRVVLGTRRPVEQATTSLAPVPVARRAETIVPTQTAETVSRPITQVVESISSPSGARERGLIQTLRESPRTPEEIAQRLSESQNRLYQPITNRETVAKANQRIAESIDKAEAYVLGAKKLTAEHLATGFRLIDELQRSGNIDRAVTIAEKLAQELTKAGQTVQAASIWNRLTAEGALVAAQRIVARINENLPRGAKGIVIDDQTAERIMSAAGAIQRAGASQERAANVMDILDRLRAGEAVSESEKQVIVDFIRDARQYVRPTRIPRVPKIPKEMQEPRVRDRVVSFLDAQERAAKERLRARGIRVSSLPLDVWTDYAIIGAAKLGKGAVKFADWSEQMVRELGEEIRPYLGEIYQRAQEILTSQAKRIREETVSRAEIIAENYLKKNEANLSPEDIELVRNLARNVSMLSGDAKRLASQDLQAILNGFERAGIGKKARAIQYIFLLLNPVTQIKNIIGNEILYRFERLSRLAATPIDWAFSKLTGKEREITFLGGPMSWSSFFAPIRDYGRGLIEGMRAGWRGVNPEGLTTAYEISGQAFRGKLNPLTYLEKTLGAVMKGFDYAAYTRAVNQRLREMAYLDAINKGIRGRENIRLHMDRYAANLEDNIAAIAQEYGKYVTFQDDTFLSRFLQSLRRGANLLTTFGRSKEFGVGSLILPFAKTPANLLMRAIDYSPAGFAKAIFQASDILRRPNTDLTRADVIQSVTRALFGTGLTGVGLWLADKGVLRGESPLDRDVRELEKQAGLSQYQFNASAFQRMLGALVTGNLKDVDEAAKLQPGDVLWQYEWAQPTSIPLAIGANIVQEQQQARQAAARGEEQPSRFQKYLDAVLGGLNTLYNTSVLQGLQQALDFPPGEENKIRSFAENVVRQIASMSVPSIVGRVNMFMDPAVRETYSPDYVENLINQARSRIPGLAQELPQRVTTLGQPMTRETNFLDVFLLPTQRSKFEPTPEAQLVFEVLSETGDERVAPRAVPRYITGKDRRTGEMKRIDLTGEQLVRYQTIVGQEVAKRIAKINPNWSTERKLEKIIDALNEAGEIGRREMRKELGLRP